MKKIISIIIIVMLVSSCTIEDQVNPNSPELADILANPSKTELNNLAIGALTGIRNNHAIWVTASGTISRELYLFDADPRNTTDLIGTKGVLSRSVFYTGANYASRYQTIKNCNILLQALENAPADVSAVEISGYEGFIKTIMAHQFLVLYGAYYSSGIRLDVADSDNLGSIITDPATVLTYIRDLLDEANTDLTGSEFAFSLPIGFRGFETPSTFSQFNRALAARAAMYDGDKVDVLTFLGDSHFDLNGDLKTGPKMDFSSAGGDLLNDLYKTPGQNGNQIVFSDTWINEAEGGDSRVASKSALRANPSSKSGINAAYETRLYESATSPISIIRNEELILLYAEANIGSDNVEAVNAIDVIRASANLGPYAGATDDASLLLEVLNQRRYSLWGEGHRMIDLRRTGNLNDTFITLDVIQVDGEDVDQVIFTEFPLPITE